MIFIGRNPSSTIIFVVGVVVEDNVFEAEMLLELYSIKRGLKCERRGRRKIIYLPSKEGDKRRSK